MNIQAIADRARELEGSMSHGHACFAACREMGVLQNEVASTAEIVSSMMTNEDINRSGGPQLTPEQMANMRRRSGDTRPARMRTPEDWALIRKEGGC